MFDISQMCLMIIRYFYAFDFKRPYNEMNADIHANLFVRQQRIWVGMAMCDLFAKCSNEYLEMITFLFRMEIELGAKDNIHF